MTNELLSLEAVREKLKKRRLRHWFPGEADNGFVFTTRISSFDPKDLAVIWETFSPELMDVTNDSENGFVHVQLCWVNERDDH